MADGRTGQIEVPVESKVTMVGCVSRYLGLLLRGFCLGQARHPWPFARTWKLVVIVCQECFGWIDEGPRDPITRCLQIGVSTRRAFAAYDGSCDPSVCRPRTDRIILYPCRPTRNFQTATNESCVFQQSADFTCTFISSRTVCILFIRVHHSRVLLVSLSPLLNRQ
jgi:hypothetical protein